MIRHLGAAAIAAAVHKRPETIRKWAAAQLRGVEVPLEIHRTRSGDLWVSAEEVDRFFSPPDPGADPIGASVAASLARLDEPTHRRERRRDRGIVGGRINQAAGSRSVTRNRQGDQGDQTRSLGALVP